MNSEASASSKFDNPPTWDNKPGWDNWDKRRR